MYAINPLEFTLTYAVLVLFCCTATIRQFCSNPERLVILARNLALAIVAVMLGKVIAITSMPMPATIMTSNKVKPHGLRLSDMRLIIPQYGSVRRLRIFNGLPVGTASNGTRAIMFVAQQWSY